MVRFPTFVVCTMHCDEPDFEHCVRSIAQQKNVNIKHIVVDNLPEVEAHNVVYRTFNDADPSWIRAKIDADVTLIDEHILERVAQDLSLRPHAAGLMPAVYDRLTDSHINAGIMFYTSAARFRHQSDPLKCDRNVLEPNVEASILDWYCVGRHMQYANELTAFRYGFHRGLKGQHQIYEMVKVANERQPDPIRKMALAGFEAALTDAQFVTWHRGCGKVPTQHNYVDSEFMRLFSQHCQ